MSLYMYMLIVIIIIAMLINSCDFVIMDMFFCQRADGQQGEEQYQRQYQRNGFYLVFHVTLPFQNGWGGGTTYKNGIAWLSG